MNVKKLNIFILRDSWLSHFHESIGKTMVGVKLCTCQLHVERSKLPTTSRCASLNKLQLVTIGAFIMLWSSAMVMCYGHKLWSCAVVMCYGHELWSCAMVMSYGHVLWSWAVVMLWSWAMVMCYGHELLFTF